jgi:hypothetical protein
MKLTKQDARILHAALNAILDGDHDLWEELDDNELDRAADLLDELASEIDLDDDDDDADDEFEDDEEA